MSRVQILVLIASLLLFILVLDLIRRGRLRARYSLVWLVGAAVVFGFGLFRGSLQYIGKLLEVSYAPSLIFMIVIIVLIIVQLVHTISISDLTAQSRDLCQKIASLDLRSQQAALHIPATFSSISRLVNKDSRKQFHLTLQETLTLLIDCLEASSGSILVLNPDKKIINGVTWFEGRDWPARERELEETVWKGLAGWVLENRQAALVINTSEDSRWLKRDWDVSSGGTRSAISVPLIYGNEIAGVVTLVQSEARCFSNDDLALLIAITKQLSHSEAIPLYEEAVAETNEGLTVAALNPITGTTTEAFGQQLEEEIA